MKSLLGKLGVILIIGLAIFSYTKVWGADWKLYGSNENGLYYYDAQSITRPSKNIVRVWGKSDYTEKGVLFMVENVSNKFENLSYGIMLREINCVEKMYRALSATFYDNKGTVIDSSSSPSEWRWTIPESNNESLYKEVCK